MKSVETASDYMKAQEVEHSSPSMLSAVNISVYPRPGKEHVCPGAVWGEGAAKPALGEQKKHQLILVKTGFSPV